MPVIEIEDLSKEFRVLNRREGLMGAMRDLFSTDYHIVNAVNQISMTIDAGEIVGYIGPNGAGKSTTIKMMTGILKPTSGTLRVNGNEPYTNRKKNAQHMGVVFGQRTQLWWDLPVIESFKILKAIYRVDDAAYERNLGMFNDLVDLKALYAKPVRTLSLGQRMLCDITASFLHSPRVVFLDEPTIGLDVSVKSKIRTLIRELNTEQKATIILTTHDISDIEALCKRVIIIDKGSVIYDDEMRKITQMFGAYRTLKLQIVTSEENLLPQVEGKLAARFGQGVNFSVKQDEEGWIIIVSNQDEVLLRDVLSFVMAEYRVNDVKIAEIATENVIQQIYDGATP